MEIHRTLSRHNTLGKKNRRRGITLWNDKKIWKCRTVVQDKKQRSPESNQESRSKLSCVHGDWFSTKLLKQFNGGENCIFFSRNSAGRTAYSHEQGNQTVSKFNPRWTNQLWAETTPREKKKTKNPQWVRLTLLEAVTSQVWPKHRQQEQEKHHWNAKYLLTKVEVKRPWSGWVLFYFLQLLYQSLYHL